MRRRPTVAFSAMSDELGLRSTSQAGNEIDFWFDFISPYGYLASLRIDDLARAHSRQVRWHVMLLGVTMLRIMRLPPIPETPLKSGYAIRELERYQRRHGQVIGRALGRPPMAPVPAAKAYVTIQAFAPTFAVPFAKLVMHEHWALGHDADTPEALHSLGMKAGLSSSQMTEVLEAPQASQLLRESVNNAVNQGVFGSPFFLVDGEPFFGVDKLELIDTWLAEGGW